MGVSIISMKKTKNYRHPAAPASVVISSLLLLPSFLPLSSFVSANSEGDALNALKLKLIDPNNVLQSWDRTLVNPCTWFHVTCDPNNNVIRVDLGNANLSGELVPDLGNLPNLQYLELYNNNIGGKIPAELGNLSNLFELNLYNNNIDGEIPAELGKLSNLLKLFLYNNKLSGKVPAEIGQLPNLLDLDLSNNCLTITPDFDTSMIPSVKLGGNDPAKCPSV